MIALALLLCSPNIAWTDERAECLSAVAEGDAARQKADYPAALRAYQRALELAPRVFGPEDLDTAAILNNLAVLFEQLGQYAEAEPLYQRSLKIRESKLGPDDPLVADSLNNLAFLYHKMGQYAKAEPLCQRSLEVYESKLRPDDPRVAMSLNQLAGLYSAMGQYAKAVPLCQRSLRIYESRFGPAHPDVAGSLNNLALVYYDMGEYAKAEPLWQRSLKISAAISLDHAIVASSLNNLAILYANMGQYEKAERFCQRGLAINESKLGPDHPGVMISLFGLAGLYGTMGQYARAEPLYQRVLRTCESRLGPDHPLVAGSLYNLASLHAASGRQFEAIAETDRERRIARRHVARILPGLNEREQLIYLQTHHEKRLHAALSLGLDQRSDGQMALQSAGWVLNGKAVAQEALAQRIVLAAEATDPALADLAKKLLSVRSQLAALSTTFAKPGQEADYRQQLNSLSQEEEELSRQLGQATGRSASGDPWVEPASVQKALAKDTLLIEITRFEIRDCKAKGKENCWLPPHYAAWIVPAEGEGRISIVDLGDAKTIDDLVQSTRTALEAFIEIRDREDEAAAETRFRRRMRELARTVLDPLEKHFARARKLVLSPDAALWLVPWDALPLADGNYAIEKYQIRHVVSGRDLVIQATAKKQAGSGPVLFANPNFDLTPRDVDASTRAVLRSAAPAVQVASSRGFAVLSGLPQFGRLPGTAEEAAAIKPSVARYAGAEATIYEGQYALEGVFKSLQRPKVLVLSTHGFFMPDQEVEHKDDRLGGLADEGHQGRAVLTTEGKPLENPLLRCGLLLAGCNQRGEDSPGGADGTRSVPATLTDDGILTGLEIVGTDLRGTELVVLSACETGVGQVRNGEGVAGLRQAFQLAGAKAVVSTLWQIPDQETVQLMTDFFANLSAGQTKADALHNAQLALIKARRESNSAAHPYYWAAFTLTGQ